MITAWDAFRFSLSGPSGSVGLPKEGRGRRMALRGLGIRQGWRLPVDKETQHPASPVVVVRRPRREGVFHPSGVVALSGVRALGVRPKAPGSSPRLAGSRVQLSRQAHPRSTTLAPAPLNIATALHAEAMDALSLSSRRGWIYFPMAFS